jgi:hypothetical protein
MFRILGTIGLLAAFPILYYVHPLLRSTALTSAWRWLMLGMTAWLAAWSATILFPLCPAAIADQMWYAVALLMVCPAIAVLGARRPGTRIWTWFVLVPLLLVLGWPALTAWDSRLQVAPLDITKPAIIAYGLVLVMGTGNYFRTRFSLSAFCLLVALVLLVLPFSSAAPAPIADRDRSRVWATLSLAAALATALHSGRRTLVAATPLDRVWIDFRDSFGIVWANRAMDRINAAAANEHWPVRLELDGFRPLEHTAGRTPRTDVEQHIEHTMRWLLRRFVDAEWIDQRLRKNPPASVAPSSEEASSAGS